MELIEFLSNPENYSESAKNFKIIQTHISFVFLLDEYVYKIKKPVNFGFLDFTTLDKRRYYCEKEIELNKRLAKGIYMGVVPISKVKDGFEFSDKNPLEYAVKMKRLPENLLLSNLIEEGVKENVLKRIADKLADFHKTAETNKKILLMGDPERFRINTDENFAQTEKYRGVTISEKKHEFIKNRVEEFYKKYGECFKIRIKQRKIKDCHGDLRMEHICVLPEDIVVFDCIEFNERFRYHDILNDIAFLTIEMDYRGFNKEKDVVEKVWFEEVEEELDEKVINLYLFYLSYRSFVRAKVTSFLLDDPYVDPEEKEKIKDRAREFFELSEKYISAIA